MITLFPAAGFIGQGLSLTGALSGFAVNPGDELSFVVQDLSLTTTVCGGRCDAGGGFFIARLGIDTIARVLIPLDNGGLAYGTAVQIFVEWIRPVPFSIIDSATFLGYFHDPSTGIDRLLTYAAHDPMLDTILACVQRTFPTT